MLLYQLIKQLLPSNPTHQTIEEMVHPLLVAHTFWPFNVDVTVKQLFDLWRGIIIKVTILYIKYSFAVASRQILSLFQLEGRPSLLH